MGGGGSVPPPGHQTLQGSDIPGKQTPGTTEASGMHTTGMLSCFNITKATVLFSDVWREYLSDEGIDLNQQLIIPNRNTDENDIAVLTDGNLTTCFRLESCPSPGTDVFSHRLSFFEFIILNIKVVDILF